MKLAAARKKPRHYPPGRPASYPPRANRPTHQPCGQEEAWEEPVDTAGSFFSLMRAAAGLTKKELVYDLGWSKTYIEGCLNGTKNDPVEQSRKFCLMLRRRNRTDLVAATIVHIAGGDDFDGAVLTREQREALVMLAKVVQP